MAANPLDSSASALPWLDHRAAGVLLHPTCFPGEFGIGTFGADARHFLDFLKEAGFQYWQVCPLGPTGYGNSPYQCFSAFAGNPYFIDLMALCDARILQPENLGPLLFLPDDRVDYGALYKLKWPILRQAFDGFTARNSVNGLYGSFTEFKEKHAAWLEPFSWYQALKQKFDGAPWYEWPEEYRSWKRFQKEKLSSIDQDWEREAEARRFYQYLFFGQWKKLRAHAASLGISIIGDIPIFVSADSADVWSEPEVFQLDKSGAHPVAVAGVPPDYFSEDGQYWGNPLFNWEFLKNTDYAWWKKRLRVNFELYDVVRIDHFRGFEAYWSIPFGAPTAKEGVWVKGPGLDFFSAIRKEFPDAKIIAEDLGTLTPEVFELLDATGLPGMAVLQFAFGGPSDNIYLPHNLKRNTVIYAGTHDNDTTLGWYESADEATRDHARRYLRVSGAEISWDFVRTAYRSVARLAIVTLQDLMSLGSSARFNTPGTQENNWQWRYTPRQLEELRGQSTDYLLELADLYGRLPGGNSEHSG